MSSRREEAAFHESGHCYVAVRVAGRVVESMSISQEDEGWDGKTSIQPDRQFGRNAQHGKDRARTANEASGQPEKEGDFVRETVGAMREITQSISDVGEIAFQTNLLALNSAIEAARAGPHGKGFAVVAGEVRKLAELSQTAAQQMSDLAKISVDVAENAAALLDRQGLISWTTIAVAGAVAEARADANRRFSRDDRLPITDELVKEVERYVDAVLLAAIKNQRIRLLQITFRTLEGNEVVGSLSSEDIDRMPWQCRDRSSLRTALEEAERVCHDPGQWRFIEELAREVMKAPDDTLVRKQIEKILGLG
jgi:Methyl-accepting chemotaxis protein (MCP) signalling domain